MSEKKITAFAPATVANVACAFDVLGFALNTMGDTVTAKFSKTPGITISKVTGTPSPTDPNKNTAGVAVKYLLDSLNSTNGIDLEIHKGLPIGSGLGSSAASAVAALVAVNKLLDEPYTKEQLVKFAIQSEAIACGSAHPDNVVPSLLGGCTLIRSVDPVDIINIPVPENLECVVVTPEIELRTEDARKILNREIKLDKVVTQLGNVAGLIAGFYRNDLELVARSLSDVIIEPQRAMLIPGFEQAKQAALKNGAIGCSISGSGPTIFAFLDGSSNSQKVIDAIVEVFRVYGIIANGFASKINLNGATVL